MKRFLQLVAASTVLAVCSAFATPTVINFDDGVDGTAVGNTYLALGVIASNVQFDTFSCQGVCGPIGALKVTNINDIYQPKVDNPMVFTFTNSVSFVSLYGVNVGANGYRLDAFDAEVSGNLIGFAENFGIGVGAQNNPLLSVSGSDIRRIEVYQPLSVAVEGALWDVLTFDVEGSGQVPEPTSLALLGLGMTGLAFVRRRKATF
jgi:hypothetical protein